MTNKSTLAHGGFHGCRCLALASLENAHGMFSCLKVVLQVEFDMFSPIVISQKICKPLRLAYQVNFHMV